MEEDKKPRSGPRSKPAEAPQAPPAVSDEAGQSADPVTVSEATEADATQSAPSEVTPEPVAETSSEPDVTLEEPLAAAAQEPPPEPEPVKPVPPARSGSGFLGTLAGGVIAAALGFGLAYYFLPQLRPPQQDPTLASRLSDQAQQIASLRAQLSDLPAPAQADTSGLETQVAQLSSALASGDSARQALADRLQALEERVAAAPVAAGDGPAIPADVMGAIASLREELTAQSNQNQSLSAELSALKQASDNRAADADARARTSQAEVAIARIRMAIETGVGYGPALDQLRSLGVTVPDALNATAAGTATLPELRRDFPEAARLALEASYRATAGSSFGDRAETFLRSQLGIRSLSPQEGTTPDAVLSRASAALESGNIAQALTEIDTLPTEGKAAMGAWLVSARQRAAAEEAADTVAAGLTTN